VVKLSRQREDFAQAYIRLGDASKAFREAYPRSVNWKKESVWSKASETLKDVKVQLRIDELRQKLEDKFIWTREKSVKALVSVVEEPDKKSDVIQAVKELNAMHGYNEPSKHELTGANGEALFGVFSVEFIKPKNSDS
jgi:phage terminase small subunit